MEEFYKCKPPLQLYTTFWDYQWNMTRPIRWVIGEPTQLTRLASRVDNLIKTTLRVSKSLPSAFSWNSPSTFKMSSGLFYPIFQQLLLLPFVERAFLLVKELDWISSTFSTIWSPKIHWKEGSSSFQTITLLGLWF